MPESSLSQQTYLASFIVPNKSISPGLSHLPLDSWLPAPISCLLASGPRVPVPAPGYQARSAPPLPRRRAEAPPLASRSLLALSYSIPGHSVPSLSSLVLGWPLLSSHVPGSPVRHHDKGHCGLRDSRGYCACSSALARAQPPSNSWPAGACVWGPRESQKYLALLCLLTLAPPGPIGWKSQAST